MRKFDMVGLEIHSKAMWYHAHIKRVLDFMSNNGFNALILHQSDLLNHLIFPRKYLSSNLMWEKFCGLRSFEIENNRLYLNNVVEEARKRGIDLYINIKEIFYTDEIVQLFPELIRMKGVVCPTAPFWCEYLEICIEELCQIIPGFKGLLLSCGTHEARTSLTQRNYCECDRCKNVNELEWYHSILKVISKPLKEHGKQFIVRDFTYTADKQDVLLKAANLIDQDIIFSLKNTPQDFFPPFIDNPVIGTTGREEWIEFDAWGQFFGAGIFPASVAEDYQKRFEYSHDRKAKGVYFRTDWEGIYENSVFSSANLVNMFAAGLLANNLDADLDEAYKKWAGNGWLETFKCDSDNPSPIVPTAPDAWKKMRNFIKASWEVILKTVYVREHWFCEDNMFPNNLDIAYKMMVYIHGRDSWEPGASDKLKATEENLKIIFEEKEQALKECRTLKDILQPETLGLPQEAVDDMLEMLKLYEVYVTIGKYSCKTVFLTKRALETKDASDRELAYQAVSDLRKYRRTVLDVLNDRKRFYPHIIFWLLNEKRMAELAEDAEDLLDGKKQFVVNKYRVG